MTRYIKSIMTALTAVAIMGGMSVPTSALPSSTTNDSNSTQTSSSINSKQTTNTKQSAQTSETTINTTSTQTSSNINSTQTTNTKQAAQTSETTTNATPSQTSSTIKASQTTNTKQAAQTSETTINATPSQTSSNSNSTQTTNTKQAAQTSETTTNGKIVLRLMGDSTMADKDLSKENQERGWGQRLPSHLDSCVKVVNYAQNGRSTKSFISRGIWDKVKADLKKGEYLFIQFGHNDSKEDDPERYAPAFGLYTENLEMFVEYALEAGAVPVIFSPVSRRWFDDKGNLKCGCHGDYPEAARKVAEKYGLEYIDANAITQEWLVGLGDCNSRKYYMWVEPGTNPRHPDGLVDNTHTNVAGARKITELLLPAITEAIPALKNHVREYDFVVAKDGSGDFFTVQEAVNAAPDYCKQDETTIFIKSGIYKEKVTIPANKQKLHIIGEKAVETIITWDDYAKKAGSTGWPMGTSATSTLFLHADDFLAENITIENTAGEGKEIGQACAITVNGDRTAFIGCRFIANQDTVYDFGPGQRHYYRDCHIEGTTDFIFGFSTAYYDRCTIVSKKNSYVTAASTPQGQKHGFVFRDCTLKAKAGTDKVYLGRPWRPYSQTVFIDCTLGGHIRKEGWHNWNKPDAEKTAFYAEYGSKGPGAAPESRVRWSRQLKPKTLKSYTPESVLGLEDLPAATTAPETKKWFFQDKIISFMK